MINLRWDPSVLINSTKTPEFWKEHFEIPTRKLLFILGKGFNVRMNIAIKSLLLNAPNVDVDCWLIEFEEGTSSSSQKYQPHVKENSDELKSILGTRNIISKQIALWSTQPKGKRQRIGDRQAANILTDYSQICEYTDIIIDISALPRGVYFSLVGKFLTFIDRYAKENPPNFFIVVSENANIDVRIKEKGIDIIKSPKNPAKL